MSQCRDIVQEFPNISGAKVPTGTPSQLCRCSLFIRHQKRHRKGQPHSLQAPLTAHTHTHTQKKATRKSTEHCSALHKGRRQCANRMQQRAGAAKGPILQRRDMLRNKRL